jgi:prepilin-type N-terminal cleavage/methylation domain-containing protein
MYFDKIEIKKKIGFFDENLVLENHENIDKSSISTRKFKNEAGFTLIELLVSISISALMSGIFLVNYHSTNKQAELNMATQKLVSDIRLVQNYSLGSTKYGESIPMGGWGVYFDKSSSPNSYVIFADSDGDMQYDIGESDIARGGQTVTLPTGISIGEINIGSVPVDSVYITFLPPDPMTNIRYDSNNYSLVDIVLLEETNNTTKTVEVNFFGLIEAK